MKIELENVLPSDIEKKSFEIIESELPHPIDEKLAPIIKRVVHTTADFDYVDSLYFSENILDIAFDALRSGATIVTDTNMARSGINKKALEKLGCKVECYMSDDDVAKQAKAGGTTRATASVDKAGRLEGPVIFACGNAPTALVRMVELMENGYGTDRQIPQLILAGASLDDVFVIVLFSTFVSMAQGGAAKVMDFVNIPVSIILGILLGAVFGFILAAIFEYAHKKEKPIRQSLKVIVILGAAFLLMAIEDRLEGIVSVSGLLAVMSMACVIQMRCRKIVSDDLSAKYGRMWLAAEVILFVLVGAAVDIRYTLGAGVKALILIIIALVFRSVGVLICLVGMKLNKKEKLYCIIEAHGFHFVNAGGSAVQRILFSKQFFLNEAHGTAAKNDHHIAVLQQLIPECLQD